MQPINYLLNNKSPLDALMGGVGQWQTMKNNDYALARTEDENKLLAAQHNNEIQGLAARQNLDFSKPDAVRQYAAMYPEQAKGVNSYLDNLSEQEKQAMLADTSKSIALISRGKTAEAVTMARTKAAAYRNAGDTKKAAEYEQMANLAEQDSNAALQHLQISYAVGVGKDGMGAYKDYMAANNPDIKVQDGGDHWQAVTRDPVTGAIISKDVGTKGIDPTKQMEADTQITTTGMNNDTSITTTGMNNKTSRDVATIGANSAATVADINGKYGIKKENITQQGQNMRAAADIEYKRQQDAINSKQGEYKSWNGKVYFVDKLGHVYDAVGQDGKPILDTTSTMTSGGREKLAEIQGNNDQINQTISSLQKALQLSQAGIYDGYTANTRAYIAGNFGGTETSKRTQEYNNLITNNALQSLKSIFGGNPTEGEREILLKIQASTDYPAAVRETIINQAIEMAKARLNSNAKQAAIISGQPIATTQTGGSYYANKYNKR